MGTLSSNCREKARKQAQELSRAISMSDDGRQTGEINQRFPATG
jgi:hypothetical protein